MRRRVSALLVANRRQVRKWLKNTPTQERARRRVTRDRDRILHVSNAVHEFRNTVAHMQLRRRTISARHLRLCLERARWTIDEYRALLAGEKLSVEMRDDLVDDFFDEVATLRVHCVA